MWRNGSLNYIMNVSPYTASIREAREPPSQPTSDYRASASRASFTILFLDEGGFKVASSTLFLTSMQRIVDATGQPQSLSYEGSSILGAGDYRRIAKWNISWSFP